MAMYVCMCVCLSVCWTLGKTTLMDCLAQRKSGGVIEGIITLNGHPPEPDIYHRVVVSTHNVKERR